MDGLFFELIRLSIDTGDRHSYYPSAKEWGALYKFANKQSLQGVCFAGVRRCMEIACSERSDAGIPPNLYMQWLASAVSIQRQNELLSQRCR